MPPGEEGDQLQRQRTFDSGVSDLSDVNRTGGPRRFLLPQDTTSGGCFVDRETSGEGSRPSLGLNIPHGSISKHSSNATLRGEGSIADLLAPDSDPEADESDSDPESPEFLRDMKIYGIPNGPKQRPEQLTLVELFQSESSHTDPSLRSPVSRPDTPKSFKKGISLLRRGSNQFFSFRRGSTQSNASEASFETTHSAIRCEEYNPDETFKSRIQHLGETLSAYAKDSTSTGSKGFTLVQWLGRVQTEFERANQSLANLEKVNQGNADHAKSADSYSQRYEGLNEEFQKTYLRNIREAQCTENINSKFSFRLPSSTRDAVSEAKTFLSSFVSLYEEMSGVLTEREAL